MHRRLAFVAALIIALTLPASASAARATKVTDQSVNLSCEEIHPTQGVGVAYFGAFASELNGTDSYFDSWDSNDPAGQPDLHRDYEQPALVAWNGSTLSGSFALADSSGNSAGTASFSATLTPIDDPYPIDDTFKDGNRQSRITGTGQLMQPSGLLTLSDGTTYDMADCYADSSTVTIFATNPNAAVRQFTARSVGCELADTSGNTGFLYVDLADDGGFADVFIDPAGSDPNLGAFGFGPLGRGTFDATLETYLYDTGESVALTSTLSLTFAATTERFEVLLQNPTIRVIARGRYLDIGGSLTVGPYTFDLGSCIGEDYREKEINTNPQGPKPGGKVPANDLPSGAKALSIGGSTTLMTKGASPDREAPFECLTFEEEDGSIFEVPVAHTVWYKVTGTGNPVTIDTTDSDFDTVVAVYTATAGGGFTPVPDACVDDVPLDPFGRSLQASVTFTAAASTVYFVQIGGYPEGQPYGNLRVSVR